MACGGDEVAMRAALTDDGRTDDGDTSPAAGMFTIEVENQTELSGAFVHLSLAAGSTVDDPRPALDRYPRQFERVGPRLPEPPDYGALPADVPAGTDALVCYVDDDLPTEQVHIAEQLDVTD